MDVFEKPQIIGKLTQQDMNAIRAACPEPDTSFHVRNDRLLDARNESFFAAVQPLYRHFKRVTSASDREQVLVSVDIKDVPRDASQRRNIHWHKDSGFCISVADALPTEFLVRDPGVRLSGEQKAAQKKIKEQGDWIAEDSELAANGLAIFSPKPLEIVALDKHFHRSPKNTGRKIARTWIRIAAF